MYNVFKVFRIRFHVPVYHDIFKVSRILFFKKIKLTPVYHPVFKVSSVQFVTFDYSHLLIQGVPIYLKYMYFRYLEYNFSYLIIHICSFRVYLDIENTRI